MTGSVLPPFAALRVRTRRGFLAPSDYLVGEVDCSLTSLLAVEVGDVVDELLLLIPVE